MLEAFFAASSSMVNRPTIRSSSVIRCCSSPRLGSVAKISAARFRSSAFQREKTGALSWCSRQISAMVLAPVISSSTRRALNSGLKLRRFAIRFPLSWTHCTLTIAPVQFLGVITLCKVPAYVAASRVEEVLARALAYQDPMLKRFAICSLLRIGEEVEPSHIRVCCSSLGRHYLDIFNFSILTR
jgi:hypothetical protein